MASRDSTTAQHIIKITQHERFERVKYLGLSLRGPWLAEAGFSQGLPVKLRIMPGCIVITAQNHNELWQCLEGLSANPFNEDATLNWLKQFPGGLMED